MATEGFVVADNDASETGEKSALATGLPYFLPPAGDFNDYHRATSTFKASQALRQWMNGVLQAA
jgi:putative DNA primase/helicase